jgi:lactate dehydrogenase-like 2-hydroxyacid dehydrogenase
VLDALGDGYLINNVSWGTLIDEPVLVTYLQEMKIAGAGSDVFLSSEPSIPEALFAWTMWFCNPITPVEHGRLVRQWEKTGIG